MDPECPFFRGPRRPDTYLALNILETGEWKAFDCGAGLTVFESTEQQVMDYVEELLKVELLAKVDCRNKLEVFDYVAGDVVVKVELLEVMS